MPTSRAHRTLRPLRFDWYVAREVIGPFLGGVVFFVFLFLMFQALRLTDLFVQHGVGGAILGKMALLLALSFLPTALPVAFLIAVLIAFGRLSSESELVAMKASGISIHRLAAPVTALALLVAVFSVFLNMQWVPWGDLNFRKTLVRVGNTQVVSSIKEGTFTSGYFDLLIFADKVDERTNRLRKVFIYDEREPKSPLTVVAASGQIVPVKTANELSSAAVLKLFNGSIHRNDSQSGTYEKIDFGEYRLFLKRDAGDDSAVNNPRMIPYRELLRLIDSFPKNSWQQVEMRGEYWRRLAVAISPLIFVFLGIGFGTIRTRAVRASAVLIALITLLTYWTLQTTGKIWMEAGHIDPITAMQLPNLVVLVAAALSFRKASW